MQEYLQNLYGLKKNKEKTKYAFMLYSGMLQKILQKFAKLLDKLWQFYFLMSKVFEQSTISENSLTESELK